jgi:hypothetical protein
MCCFGTGDSAAFNIETVGDELTPTYIPAAAVAVPKKKIRGAK